MGEIAAGAVIGIGVIALFATGHWVQGLILLILGILVGYFHFKNKGGS